MKVSDIQLLDLQQAQALNEILKKASFTLSASDTVKAADALGWFALLIRQIGHAHKDSKEIQKPDPEGDGFKVMDYKPGDLTPKPEPKAVKGKKK